MMFCAFTTCDQRSISAADELRVGVGRAADDVEPGFLQLFAQRRVRERFRERRMQLLATAAGLGFPPGPSTP